MNELVKHQQPQGTLTERMNYARALATAELLPPAYRNNPGNVLLAVEYGNALNIPPMTAIQGVHVIQGKPTLSADLMAALVRRAGHKLRVQVDDAPEAVAQLIRADDPDFTYECRWDMERAKRADLLGKGTWKAHPKAMLKARAIAEVVREGASEVLHGVIYTADELGAEVVDGEEVTVNTETGEIVANASDTTGDAIAQEHAAQDEYAEDKAEETLNQPITPGQLKKIGAMMREQEITDRTAALNYVAAVIGRDISSRNDLTKHEAHAVIEALDKDAAALKVAAESNDVVDGEVVEEGDA